VCGTYVFTDRLRRLADAADDRTRAWSRNWNTEVTFDPDDLVGNATIFGALFGSGYVGLSRVLPRSLIAGSSLYGIVVWGLLEGMQILAPGRSGGWVFGAPSRSMPRLAMSGVAVALAAGR
jgi:hypothetical protein